MLISIQGLRLYNIQKYYMSNCNIMMRFLLIIIPVSKSMAFGCSKYVKITTRQVKNTYLSLTLMQIVVAARKYDFLVYMLEYWLTA